MTGHPCHANIRLPSGRIVNAEVIARADDGELTVIWGGLLPFKAHPLTHEEILQIEETTDENQAE